MSIDAPELVPCPRCGIPIEEVTANRKPAHRIRTMLVYDGRVVHTVDSNRGPNRHQIAWMAHGDLCDAIVAARGAAR